MTLQRRLSQFFKDPFAQVFMVITVLLVLVLADGYRPYVTPAPADKLSDFFEAVAFGSEYGEDTEHVARWQGALRIYITGDTNARQREDLKLVLAKLARLSGLELIFDQSKTANYEIRFIKHDDIDDERNSFNPDWKKWNERPQDVNCYGFIWNKTDDEADYIIYHSVAVISTDLPQDNFFRAFIEMLVSGSPYKWNQSCLREELMQSLGLPKDSDIVTPSVVNDSVQYDIYSANDMILIRTLYDPRLQAGMPKAEAMKLVRRTIIPELIAAFEAHGEEALYQ